MGDEKKKILVVEDDVTLRAGLQKVITEKGYDVIVAADGKIGLQLFLAEDVDLVLSDIRMPNMNGILLLQSIKKLKPVPVIIMTGFSELCETQEAYQMGAKGFLAKPFKREDLLSQIRKCLGSGTTAANQDLSDRYSKLNIEDFASGHQIQFDIHIKLSNTNFVKIAHKGEDIPIDRIRVYKNKGIRHLYMHKEDFHRYLGFNIELKQNAAEPGAPISQEKKATLLKHTQEMLLHCEKLEGIDKESFASAKTYVEAAINVLVEEKSSLRILYELSTHSDALYVHSVGVSLLGALIAKELQWTYIINLFKIAMGGILHDVGKKEIDPKILAKKRSELSIPEVKLIEGHSLKGLEILSKIKAISGDVLQIVLQHHENCGGDGYPAGIKKKNIHPLARLISVASSFMNLVIPSATERGMAPKEAIKQLINFSWDKLDGEYLDALARVFGISTQIADLGKDMNSWKSKL